MRNLMLALFVISGCATATVDVPRVCDSSDVSFPGASPLPGMSVVAKQSFVFPTGFGKDLLTRATILDGTLTFVGTDSSMLDEVMVSVVDPNGGDDLVLWDSQHPSGAALNVVASDKNLVSYIDKDNNLTINISVSGSQPPLTDWKITASLCASAEASKTYGL
jgi:hypothetical protein